MIKIVYKLALAALVAAGPIAFVITSTTLYNKQTPADPNDQIGPY